MGGQKKNGHFFKEKYLIELTKESCIKPGAKEILDLLKQILTENSYLREILIGEMYIEL